MQWKFTDRYGKNYEEQVSTDYSWTITGVNSTWVNYSLISQQNVYSIETYSSNGGWRSERIDGELVVSGEMQINRTIDPYRQYLYFEWQDFPRWKNNTAGIEFQTWNYTDYGPYGWGEYDSRFYYFDMIDDVALDRFQFYTGGLFFASDREEYINLLEKQWKVYSDGDVSGLSKVTWNTTQNWSTFRWQKLLDNIAYSAKVLKNDSETGSARIIEFTPQWVGNYWFPDSFNKWNGTAWDSRVNMEKNFADTENPLIEDWNGTDSIFVLRDDLNYFAETTLNRRISGLSDAFSNIEVNFGANSYSIKFDVEIEDINRNTYHDWSQWSERRRNKGTLSVIKEEEFDSEKGYLKSATNSWEFDFGNNGKYSEVYTTRPAASSVNFGFEFPVFLLSMTSIVLILKKKRGWY